MEPEKTQLIAAAKVRELLDIKPMTEWRLRQRPDFPKPVRLNRRIFYKLHEIAQYVDQLQEPAQ